MILLYTSGSLESHKNLGKKLSELKPGDYVLTIKKNRAVRSLSQNKYYHCILKIVGIETGHTHDELHEALKLKFNASVIFFPKGGSQIVGKSTSDLDTKEFTSYINQVKNWAMHEFGIVIPELKDLDYMRWIAIENTYAENQQG